MSSLVLMIGLFADTVFSEKMKDQLKEEARQEVMQQMMLWQNVGGGPEHPGNDPVGGSNSLTTSLRNSTGTSGAGAGFEIYSGSPRRQEDMQYYHSGRTSAGGFGNSHMKKKRTE